MNSTFGTATMSNPRPFKCTDCKIAFRIHGHLAKHLRSKMHIMRLECLGKLPFGMYAELERSGLNIHDIDTTDCHNSLESLQVKFMTNIFKLKNFQNIFFLNSDFVSARFLGGCEKMRLSILFSVGRSMSDSGDE